LGATQPPVLNMALISGARKITLLKIIDSNQLQV
jgi:hypothetical protein